MTDFVSIYADGDSGKVVTVTQAFAEGIGAVVLEDVPATDRRGRPLPARDLPERAAKSATVEEVLAGVGDDPAAAAVALEQEKAGKNRTTLVSKLEAIANPSPSGDAGNN